MSSTRTLLIFTHLGLGDHIMCCGLSRHIISKAEYDHYYIRCADGNARNVAPLFNDLKNVSLSLLSNPIPSHCGILKIGFGHLHPHKHIDQSFYDQVGIPLSYKWSKFHIERDMGKEQVCFEKNTPRGDYIFVHDHCSGGGGTGKSNYELRIDSKLPQVRPTDLDYTIGNYLTVIERAKEVHVLNSSFLNLIDLSCDRKNMFFHNANSFHVPMSDPILPKDKWVLVRYTE